MRNRKCRILIGIKLLKNETNLHTDYGNIVIGLVGMHPHRYRRVHHRISLTCGPELAFPNRKQPEPEIQASLALCGYRFLPLFILPSVDKTRFCDKRPA